MKLKFCKVLLWSTVIASLWHQSGRSDNALIHHGLIHRYSFLAVTDDSVGPSHGTLMNGAVIAGGQVILDGTNAYVNLPGGLLDGLSSTTLEFWASFGSNGNWARVYDFGDRDGNGEGANYIFFTPRSEHQDHRMGITDADPGYNHEEFLAAAGTLDGQTNVHIACVYDAPHGLMSMYTNGVLESTSPCTFPLSSVRNVFSYLGRSLYAADAYLNGSIDEFRIYQTALTGPEILASFAAGPDALNNPRPVVVFQPQSQAMQPGSNVTFSVVAGGAGPLSYQWTRDGINLAEGERISGSTAAALTLQSVSEFDLGTYRVVITNTYGSVTSSPVDLSFEPLLPAPWQHQDVGTVNLAGSAAYDNGLFTVQGSGDDIWNNADAFHFVHQPLEGDGQIVARVVTLQHTFPWAKAGVMMRETLSPSSRHVLMEISAEQGAEFDRRQFAGGNTAATVVPGLSAPYWVKLTRLGDTFTGYASVDGSNWVSAGSDTLPMASEVCVGLAVCAVNNSVLNTSTFDHVSVQRSPLPTDQLIITSQPQNQSIWLGSNVTFSVAASSTTALSYQWHKDGALLPGESGPVLHLPAVTANDSGNYTVILSNACGSTVSSPALLTVLVPRVIMVTSTSNDGRGSLRSLLGLAPAGSTLKFDPSVFPPDAPATIFLTSGLETMTQGYITIDASDAGVIVNGSQIGVTPEITLIDDVELTLDGGTNVLINGDFSDGFNHWSTFDGEPGRRVLNTADYVSGPQSYEVHALAHSSRSHYGAETWYDTMCRSIVLPRYPQDNTVWIPASPGQQVSFSFRFKNPDWQWITTLTATVMCRRSNVWEPEELVVADMKPGSTVWTNAAVSATLPPDAEAIAVRFTIGHSHRYDNAFHISSPGNVLRGLQILHFPGSGIVLANNSSDTVIGGSRDIGLSPSGQGNLISGNGDQGIAWWNSTISSNVVITGNIIGSDLSGSTALGNGHAMGQIRNSRNLRIGGDSDGEANLVCFNRDGIEFDNSSESNVTLTRNSVYANNGKGIGRATSGCPAPPVILLATTNSVTGMAAAGCRVEIFSDDADEGRYFEGVVEAHSTGHFIFSKPGRFTSHHVTATATDPAGNTSEFSAPWLIIEPANPTGALRRQIWWNISGTNVSDLTDAPQFLEAANVDDFVLSIESTCNAGENGERLSGWLLPPVTGEYVFYLSSCDASKAWLSTGGNPNNKRLIVEVPSCNGNRNWESGKPEFPQHASLPIQIEGGTWYYLEILRKARYGGYVAMNWKLPGAPAPINWDEPIQGTYLAYSFDPSTPAIWITSQPESQAVAVGSNVVFSVAADSLQPVAFQWQHCSTDLPNATNAIFTLAVGQTNQAGEYQVCLFNDSGSVTSTIATLKVLQLPRITAHPRSQAAVPGGSVTFQVSATSPTPKWCQWCFNGVDLACQTNSALVLTNIQGTDFGDYTVRVGNEDGATLSKVATLTTALPPRLTLPILNLSTLSLTFTTEVGPRYVVEYKDRLDDVEWHMLTTVSGTGAPLTISDNNIDVQSRFYRIVVR